MGELKYLANVVTLELDADKCLGCGMCLEVCPQGVFLVQAGKALIADRDACMECGACAGNCPVQALSVDSGVGCASAVIYNLLWGKAAGDDCGCGTKCCGE